MEREGEKKLAADKAFIRSKVRIDLAKLEADYARKQEGNHRKGYEKARNQAEETSPRWKSKSARRRWFGTSTPAAKPNTEPRWQRKMTRI